jgi:integrase
MDDNDRKTRKRRRERGVFERQPGSGVWWARYTDEQGRVHREVAGTKVLARQLYQKRKTEVRERRFFPEQQQAWDPTFAERIADYLARRRSTLRDPAGADRYARYWCEAPETAGKTMRALTTQDFERYRERRRTGAAPGAKRKRGPASVITVNKELSFARAVFNDFREALEDRKQPPIANPVRSRLFAPEPPGRTRYLSEDEEQCLCAELPGFVERAAVRVAIHTGLDRGAQFGLRWSDVDVVTRTIHTVRRKGRRKGATPVNVRINDELLGILQTLPSRCVSEWVFPDASGTAAMDGREFDRLVFRPALVRAGVAGFRWKDLRHTFATRLRMQNVDLKSIGELMGHTTTRMTERYAHAAPDHLLATVQRISREPTGTATDTSVAEGA